MVYNQDAFRILPSTAFEISMSKKEEKQKNMILGQCLL